MNFNLRKAQEESKMDISFRNVDLLKYSPSVMSGVFFSYLLKLIIWNKSLYFAMMRPSSLGLHSSPFSFSTRTKIRMRFAGDWKNEK